MDHEDEVAVKSYFYNLVPAVLTDDEFGMWFEGDEITVARWRLDRVVEVVARRLSRLVAEVKSGPDVHVSFVVYGLVTKEGNVDFVVNVNDGGYTVQKMVPFASGQKRATRSPRGYPDSFPADFGPG